MIDHLNGIIKEKAEGYLILSVNGIGYNIKYNMVYKICFNIGYDMGYNIGCLAYSC